MENVLAYVNPRSNWSLAEVNALYQTPLMDLLFLSHQVHRHHFNPNQIQVSTLLSMKTGLCPEDCAYCPQSAYYETGAPREAFWPVEEVVDSARKAKEGGATRFCMGAAWRDLPDRELPKVIEIIKGVRALGLETCLTAGMLTKSQAEALAEAGLAFYNHNLDTSREYYPSIISTRTYDERLDTLEKVREAGMHVCSGGIVGLGETIEDRLKLLIELANLQPAQPESVPINQLIRVEGTPLGDNEKLDPIAFVRMIAVARLMLPRSYVRLSAGRFEMSDELQAMCFFAGANSIHTGEKLLVTPLKGQGADFALLQRLGVEAEPLKACC